MLSKFITVLTGQKIGRITTSSSSKDKIEAFRKRINMPSPLHFSLAALEQGEPGIFLLVCLDLLTNDPTPQNSRLIYDIFFTDNSYSIDAATSNLYVNVDQRKIQSFLENINILNNVNSTPSRRNAISNGYTRKGPTAFATQSVTVTMSSIMSEIIQIKSSVVGLLTAQEGIDKNNRVENILRMFTVTHRDEYYLKDDVNFSETTKEIMKDAIRKLMFDAKVMCGLNFDMSFLKLLSESKDVN